MTVHRLATTHGVIHFDMSINPFYLLALAWGRDQTSLSKSAVTREPEREGREGPAGCMGLAVVVSMMPLDGPL